MTHGGVEIEISEKVARLAKQALDESAAQFARIDEIAQSNTAKVLAAFRRHKVSEACFYGTTGYGYNDKGREVLDMVFADVFGAQNALVRTNFVNGTHAITAALFAALRPGRTLLSVTGTPYDTLLGVIGLSGDYRGSLKEYGVGYAQMELWAELNSKPNSEQNPELMTEPSAELKLDGNGCDFGGSQIKSADSGSGSSSSSSELIDYEKIAEAARLGNVGAVYIQRSRGYTPRRALTVADIGRICEVVHKANPCAVVIVDNCYGEFVETIEPCDVGADIVAGSLIKNPGGGLAPTGGYVAGKAELVEAAAFRLTSPGIGAECGATLGVSRLLYQGLFLAPHTVAQAMKTAVFCARLFQLMGYAVSPGYRDARSDIVQMVELGSKEMLEAFCKGIQSGSPIDSFVTPEAWNMPGYDCPVIMAAGAFVQGSSIELSADGPMRPPFRAYVQGGLTFESGKLGIMLAASMLDSRR